MEMNEECGCEDGKCVECCKHKFDNIAHFRGFPRMPTEEEARHTFGIKSKDNPPAYKAVSLPFVR